MRSNPESFARMARKALFPIGFALVDFEGLAGFIVFLLILLALLLFAVYKLAYIIVPSVAIALVSLVALFIPFHLFTKATVQTRSRSRINKHLLEIRHLEHIQAPREQILALEQRVRESAQALVNEAYERLRHVELWSGMKSLPLLNSKRRDRSHRMLRTVRREVEELRIAYSVAPDLSRWVRLCRMHLEWESVRALCERPRLAQFLLLGIVAVFTTMAAAMLPK